MRYELKKHFKQMTVDELTKVTNMVGELITKIENGELEISLTYHCMEKIQERSKRMTSKRIKDTILHGQIVEYKQVFEGQRMRDRRVVLRGKKKYDGQNYCVVVSLITGKVITFWTNTSRYTHEGVNLIAYDNDMII